MAVATPVGTSGRTLSVRASRLGWTGVVSRMGWLRRVKDDRRNDCAPTDIVRRQPFDHDHHAATERARSRRGWRDRLGFGCEDVGGCRV